MLLLKSTFETSCLEWINKKFSDAPPKLRSVLHKVFSTVRADSPLIASKA